MAFKPDYYVCYNSKRKLVTVAELTEAEAKQELCRLMGLIEKIDDRLRVQSTIIEDWRCGRRRS